MPFEKARLSAQVARHELPRCEGAPILVFKLKIRYPPPSQRYLHLRTGHAYSGIHGFCPTATEISEKAIGNLEKAVAFYEKSVEESRASGAPPKKAAPNAQPSGLGGLVLTAPPKM